MWTAKDWEGRVKEFLASTESVKDKYSWPFPMGVFGTLRKYQGNNRRMDAGKISNHSCGFLPHFYAHGLSISYQKDACAPFEVFEYDQSEWNKMIPGVDALEGFSPSYAGDSWEYGYYRTLVWIHLLPPKNLDRHWFPEGTRANLGEHRDMKIDPATWSSYERIPAWVYSNVRSNKALTASVKDNSPLIWPIPKIEEVIED